MPQKKKLYISDNPDLSKYVIVHSKEGDFLRAKRKDPYINEAFAAMAAETCSTAAKQIVSVLLPFTEKMEGRKTVRISGKMRTAKKLTGFYDYSSLLNFEYQKEYPLDALYRGQYRVRKDKRTVYIDVPVQSRVVNAKNPLVTEFYFETILILGDAMIPNSLRVEEDRSPLYNFKEVYDTSYNSSFVLPENTPYLVLLKVGCMEGRQVAHHPKHYGMRVVAVGVFNGSI